MRLLMQAPKLLPTLLLLLLCSQPADSLFLRTSSAIIRRPPSASASRSLFGYRVAVIKDNSAGVYHLLVTDPVGYHPATLSASGTAHLCPISVADFNTSRAMCSGPGLPFSRPADAMKADSGSFAQFSQFGASLTSLPDGQFAVCAPGHNFASPAFNLTATPGLCGYWRSASSEPVWLQKFFPYIAGSKGARSFGNCLGGFQAALSSSGAGSTQLTVSGPFCMFQRMAFVVEAGGAVNSSASSASPGDVFGSPQAVTHEESGCINYLGYSLATDPDSGVVYATSPIIQHSRPTLLARLKPGAAAADSIQVVQPFYDYLYGSFNYLGYSSAVISASLKTKRKALLLGAPFHSDGIGADSLDRGCVFVLALESLDGAPIDDVSSAPARYCGREPGGRLGTDVVGIGDVNYDDIEDFAVGCPGCGANGTGAVYLFLGLADYASPTAPLEPFEIVRAADLKAMEPNITGFGWSLALAPDLDGNTVSELVVGAVASRHAVVLPGRLLLVTGIDLRYAYANASTEEEFKTETPIQLFSRHLAKPIVATIRMHTKPGVDLSAYRFNLRVRPEELASTEQQRRFLIELIDCPSAAKPGADGWCQLTRAPGKSPNMIQFSLTFLLRPLQNNRRHSPPDVMLRDLSLLMHWSITDRAILAGSAGGLFPAVLHGQRVFPGYEDAFVMPLYRFTTGVCDSSFGCSPSGNLRLELLGGPSVMLKGYQQLQVTLRVRKKSSDPYYGGTAIRLDPSGGIHVLDAVTVREKSFRTGVNHSVSEARYWSQHNEVLLTEPFPALPDVMTRDGQGQLEVTLRLNFDGRRTAYRVGFHLVNLLGDVAGYRDFVTRDSHPLDHWAELAVTFNTSVSLRLVSATDESMVADARRSSSVKETELMALRGATAASVIGPGLQHTFELVASMRPAAAIRGLRIAVRVPLVTNRGHMLLYFPKNSLAWSHTAEIGADSDRTSQYLPGLPFTSDDAEGFVGNQGRECLPLEPDMAVLLANPPLTLLESQHEVNIFHSDNASLSEHDGERKRRSLNDEASPTLKSPTTSPSPSSPPTQTEPTFDCDRPELAPLPFRCVTFSCPVRNLGRDGVMAVDRIFLHLHARLWSPTYFRHHLGRFNIRSRVELNLPPPEMFAFRQVDAAGNSSILQTFLFLSIRPPMVDRIPWGYIILAIFLGIWLLLLLILLLWYCNFFHRKTPPQDYNSVPQKDANDDDFYR